MAFTAALPFHEVLPGPVDSTARAVASQTRRPALFIASRFGSCNDARPCAGALGVGMLSAFPEEAQDLEANDSRSIGWVTTTRCSSARRDKM